MTTIRNHKKLAGIMAGLITLAALAFIILRVNQVQGQTADNLQTGEIVTAFEGDLAASASASGQVLARRQATLALATSGQVAPVMVEVGDRVRAGDVLVQLESDSLKRAVASAEQALIIQEANLAQLQEGASAADVAAAEAAVSSAQAQLADSQDGPNEEEVAAAAANLRAAQANVQAAVDRLAQAQAGAGQADIAAAQADVVAAQVEQEQLQEVYDKIIDACFKIPTGDEICPLYGPPEERTRFSLNTANASLAAAQAKLDALLDGPDPDAVAVAQAGVAAAAARRDAAQARLDLVKAGPTTAEIAAAQAQVAQARSQLDQLLSGASAEQLAMAAAQVEQARIALERARNNLADATLVAPFDGLVTAVYVRQGEQASGPAVALVDSQSLEVVLDVDEIDVGVLAVGQPATITLETWPDQEIEGQVVSIAPKNTAGPDSALVTYKVHLGLGQTDLPVRLNMTANASLTTAQRQDVLLVPNRAIIADRETGKFYVNRVQEGPDGQAITQTEVTIGLRDDQYTQISSGLSPGDRLLLDSSAPRIQFNGPVGNGG